MSFNRRQKRNKTIHSSYVCTSCGKPLKFYKNIAFKKDTAIIGKKETIRYTNVYWCKGCGALYEPKEKTK